MQDKAQNTNHTLNSVFPKSEEDANCSDSREPSSRYFNSNINFERLLDATSSFTITRYNELPLDNDV